MRRSICVCEPSYCLAGEIQTFKFIYTPSTNIPKGAKLRFDLASRKRPVDWEIPEVQSKDKNNQIWAEFPPGKQITPKIVEKDPLLSPFFEFILPSDLKAGESFTIFLGSPLKNKELGSRAQTLVQRRRPFYLLIDPKGKNDFKEQESFHLDIRGNVLSNIRIIAPSLVEKNSRFDVVVRFEDSYGNLTSNTAEESLIELSYENLRENLSWKLFIPETGFINLPNLYFNEVGVYKICLKNLKTNETFFSAPIKCLVESPHSLYWGVFHGESEKFDSKENMDSCLRFFRDEKALHFFASSSFEDTEETSNEIWKTISTQLVEFNEDQRFNTFLGFQFFSKEADEGLRQFVYFKENKPIYRKKDPKTNTLKKLYQSLNPKEVLSIPSFSMAKGCENNFESFYPEFEKVVEIYNAWGSSECLEKEGNPRPIKALSKQGKGETEKGSIRNALMKNHRFGFVAGGFDDRGVYKDLYENEQVQYTAGLTAILATAQTKEALLQALQARSCYATTGARIILGFYIAGLQMGSEISTKAKPGLALNRHITGYVAGTCNLKEVILFRNGVPLKVFKPANYSFDLVFDDSDLLSKVSLKASEKLPDFTFYYLRVEQEDGHLAWSSPIWIDLSEKEEMMASHVSVVKKTKKK